MKMVKNRMAPHAEQCVAHACSISRCKQLQLAGWCVCAALKALVGSGMFVLL